MYKNFGEKDNVKHEKKTTHETLMKKPRLRRVKTQKTAGKSMLC